MTLDENFETFVVYVAFLNVAPRIHPDKTAQIIFLLIKKVKILDEYLDFVEIFSKKKNLVLLERTKLIEHIIDLENGKQPFY